MKKKIVLTLAVVAGVFVLAVVILFFVVDVDSFRGYIETRAEEVLGRDVRLGTIGLSVVPVFGLQVDDVAVAARPGEGEGDLLTLRSLRVGARLIPLLKKRLEVTSIVLVEPSVNLVRDAEGNWNFDLGAGGDASEEGGRTAEPGGAPQVTVDTIRVTGGSFSVRDASRSPAQPLEVALTDLDLEISGFGNEEFRIVVESGRLEVADAALASEPLRLGVGAIDLAVRGGGDSIDLTHAELVVGQTTITLTGTVEAQPDGRRIDLDLKPTSIDLADISSLLAKAGGNSGVSITGNTPVELEAGVHGVLTENRLPEVNLQAKLSGITIDATTLTRPVTGISAVATLRGTTVAVDGFHARVGDSDFAGTLEFAIGDRPVLEFALESQRADLGELLGLMAVGDERTGKATPPDADSFVVRGVAGGSLKVAEGSWVNLRFRDLDARLRLENGIATLDPVSMELYDGRFSGRLASDLTQIPQSFEFSGDAENVDMDPFVADQTGMSDILMGRFTGRVAGQGSGADPTTVIRSLEGEGVARIIDGQVGKLDVLRSVGQVAGVLGQRTLANLASDSATGATQFSQLAGDFRIGGGALSFDSVLLQSAAFDLTGTGTVDMISSVMNGAFQIQFSPQVSAWMKQESSRAAELFWDSKSDRVVLPLGLSGPLDSAGASVDWGAAAEGVARRAIEGKVNDVLGNLFGGSRDDQPDEDAVTSSDATAVSPAGQAPNMVPNSTGRAEVPSGRFALEVVKTGWGGSFFAQDYKIQCRVTGTGVVRAVMTAVDAGGREVKKTTVDLAARLADASEASFEVRVDGKKLVLARYPVTVTLTASAADGETAELALEIEEAGS